MEKDLVLPKRFRDIERIAEREYAKALRRAGRGLVRQIQKTMVDEDAVVTFETYNAVEAGPVQFYSDRMLIEVGVWGDRAEIFRVLDEGREPGHMPPVAEIKEWLAARKITEGMSEEDAEGMAWATARSIMHHGTEGRDILDTSTGRYNSRIAQIFEAATKRIAAIVNDTAQTSGDTDD